MYQYEMVDENLKPEWLRKCEHCTHAYVRQSEDLEVRCRCRKGCNFKQRKDMPKYEPIG